MEKDPGFLTSETVFGDDILTVDAAREIMDVLIGFADSGNFSREELHEYENRIKRAKILEIMKEDGTYDGQEIVLGEEFLIDEYLDSLPSSNESLNDYSRSDKESIKTLPDDTSFYTTDVLTSEDSARISKENPALFKKILKKHFYQLKGEMDQYYSFQKKADSPEFGFPSMEIDSDLRYLGELKEKIGRALSDEVGGEGRQFEQQMAEGIGVGNWLLNGDRDFFRIGKLKETLDYDDVVNGVDLYCPVSAFKKNLVVGFDATTNPSEDSMLLKLDRSASSFGVPPFGFNFVKYCHIDEDSEYGFKEENGPKMVPVYKISLDHNGMIGMGELNKKFNSVSEDGLAAINYLRRTLNPNLMTDERYFELRNLIESGGPFSDETIEKFQQLHSTMDTLKNLTTSFFVLSEIHEQNVLIQEQDEKTKQKKFRTRSVLKPADLDNIKKFDGAIWSSLVCCMNRLIASNGESENFKYKNFEDIYNMMKKCAGCDFSDYDPNTNAYQTPEHNFGLQLFSKNGSGENACYVNLLKCIESERNDVVYRELYRNESGDIMASAHSYKPQLDGVESRKELARDIFSTMAFDSYLDNFEDLYQIAKETNSVKVFIERLGRDDSGDIYGRTKDGLMRVVDENGRDSLKIIQTIGAKNHDDIILALFNNEEDRRTYFSGKNGDYAANCLSDEYFSDDDNILQLIKWGVSEGRISYILNTRFNIPTNVIKSRISKIKSKGL